MKTILDTFRSCLGLILFTFAVGAVSGLVVGIFSNPKSLLESAIFGGFCFLPLGPVAFIIWLLPSNNKPKSSSNREAFQHLRQMNPGEMYENYGNAIPRGRYPEMSREEIVLEKVRRRQALTEEELLLFIEILLRGA